ncbi:MAG: iron-containing alcohol dehydrogenase [Marinibacterium sp.]
MNDFAFNTTPRIRAEAGGAASLGAHLYASGLVVPGDRILLVTDPGIVRLDLAAPALDDLRDQGLEVTVFDAVDADPREESVINAAQIARETGARAVIGFGGGSPMDVAKVAALLARSDQALEDIYGVDRARGPRLPLILVPTTAGTGSEVTPVAILTTGTTEKKGVVSSLILPDLALLDAELTLGLPPATTAATGMDAMVHAIEAYTSTSANNNPVSRTLAVGALRLLGGNIRRAVADGSDRDARSAMLVGSMMAGQAFANSPVAAVHALAYPIGALFHVPHGLSNALILSEVMRFNAPACGAVYAELAPHFFPDIDTGRSSQTITAELIERLGALGAELGLGPGLKSVGIGAGDIDRLAEDAMNQTRLLVNNPRTVTLADARAIYRAAL